MFFCSALKRIWVWAQDKHSNLLRQLPLRAKLVNSSTCPEPSSQWGVVARKWKTRFWIQIRLRAATTYPACIRPQWWSASFPLYLFPFRKIRNGKTFLLVRLCRTSRRHNGKLQMPSWIPVVCESHAKQHPKSYFAHFVSLLIIPPPTQARRHFGNDLKGEFVALGTTLFEPFKLFSKRPSQWNISRAKKWTEKSIKPISEQSEHFEWVTQECV